MSRVAGQERAKRRHWVEVSGDTGLWLDINGLLINTGDGHGSYKNAPTRMTGMTISKVLYGKEIASHLQPLGVAQARRLGLPFSPVCSPATASTVGNEPFVSGEPVDLVRVAGALGRESRVEVVIHGTVPAEAKHGGVLGDADSILDANADVDAQVDDPMVLEVVSNRLNGCVDVGLRISQDLVAIDFKCRHKTSPSVGGLVRDCSEPTGGDSGGDAASSPKQAASSPPL